jgi:hypothetical protein
MAGLVPAITFLGDRWYHYQRNEAVTDQSSSSEDGRSSIHRHLKSIFAA